MLELTIDGIEEVQEILDRIIAVAGGSWEAPLGGIGVGLQRYAVGISPVVTGSYAGAHRVTLRDREIELSIDPRSRNIANGAMVSGYAGSVEAKHRVYEQTAGQLFRLAVSVEDALWEEMGL